MNPAAPLPPSTPPRFDLAVICLDQRCPQKLSCARWQPPAGKHAWLEARPLPGGSASPERIMALPTLRAPHECRCRPCRDWLAVDMARQELTHG